MADAILEGRSQIIHEIVKNEFVEVDEAMTEERFSG
jgi:hypothetical protein